MVTGVTGDRIQGRYMICVADSEQGFLILVGCKCIMSQKVLEAVDPHPRKIHIYMQFCFYCQRCTEH